MKIILNDQSFRYDVHSLVKAFYPDEELNYDIINKDIPGDTPEISFDSELSIIIPSKLASLRTEAKNIFKRDLYDILSKHTNRTLSWGTLTGIRPVKIPAKMLREGKDISYIDEYLKEVYYVSKEKRDLIIGIAKRENTLLSDIDMQKSASLYIGIPFCPSICAYCSFSSYPYGMYKDRVDSYIDALKTELSHVAEGLKKNIVTIYIGGGTPSTLSPNQLEELLDCIKCKFNLSYLKEITVECGRPDSITREKLMVLKNAGVNRISINPQSMNQKTLDIIGRAHSVYEIEKAFALAKEVGIEIINCDLIAGLPGEEIDEVKYTLNKITELCPDNITVHSLAIKRASELNLNAKWENMHSKITPEIMNEFHSTAHRMGMSPYYLYRQKQMTGNMENIGFAPLGLECLYNCLIMGEYQDIIACGAGSVSKFTDTKGKPYRVSNVKDVDVYISRINEMIERKEPWL